MNIKQAKKQIRNAMVAYFTKDEFGHYIVPPEKQRPVFLMGPPGIGKTAIMEQIARELGVGLVSYSMTHHTRQSALGLPFIVEKEYGGKMYSISEYTMSEILASVYDHISETGHQEGILFLDEINCVSETLTPAMLQFLQYKTFGRHRVPNGWIVLTAGNPLEYNSSAREFDIATWDRLKRIDIEPDYTTWKEYACETGVHPAVTTYLDYKKEDFYSVKNTVDGKLFVTARGWSDLSDMIRLYERHDLPVDEDLVRQYLQNPEIAKNFAVYYDLFTKYRTDYQIGAILGGTEPAEIRSRASRAPFDERISLLGLLLDAVSEETAGVLETEGTLKHVMEALRKARVTLKRPDADPSEVLGRHIDLLRQTAAQQEEAAGAVSAECRSLYQAAEILRNYEARSRSAEAADPASRKAAVFELWLKDFNAQNREMQARAAKVSEKLEHLFAFCERVFPDGQELVILVTELTIRPQTSGFIARYGSEGYYRNNKKLQFSERSRELKEQADRYLAEQAALPGLDTDLAGSNPGPDPEMPADETGEDDDYSESDDVMSENRCYFP